VHVDDSSIGTELCVMSLLLRRVNYISLQSLSLAPLTVLAFIPDVMHTHGYWRVCRQACTFAIIAIVSDFLILKGKETSGHGNIFLDNTIMLIPWWSLKYLD